jgi:hypothetical protein
MIYKSCSIEQVIARIIRNTRINDVSYIQDMNEWIPEAMGLMKTQYQHVPTFQTINVDFHKAKLPCDLASLEAVIHNGVRVETTTALVRPRAKEQVLPTTDSTNVFTSTTVQETTPDGNHIVWNPSIVSTQTLLDVKSIKKGEEWYNIELDYLNTSICEGPVTLYYLAIPTDENGLPLIPDNEDYKQALYYYVRAMMWGTGYEDKLFNYETLMQRFEVHAARAMGQIRYPSVDMKEAQLQMRYYTLPEHYWDRMFSTENNSTVG